MKKLNSIIKNFGDWKQFQINERSQELGDNEFLQELRSNCGYLFQENGMFVLQKNIPEFFRGLEEKGNYLKISPRDFNRAAKGSWITTFLYNFSEVYCPPENRRQRSVIFTNSENTAGFWGSVYRVFPFSNTKISICEKDFNFSPPVREFKDFLNLEYRQIFKDIEYHSPTLNFDYKQCQIKISEIFEELKISKLENWRLEDLFETLFDSLNTYVPTEDYQKTILEKVKKLWGSFETIELNKNNIKIFLEDHLLEKEYWTEGECLIIKENLFANLYNKNSHVPYEKHIQKESDYPHSFE